MIADEAFGWCAVEVRRNDYDRYLSVLFAPKPARPHLFALYAVNHEIAKTAEVAHDPMMGAIRLQWWHEAFDELFAGKPRHHQALLALSETLKTLKLPRALFDEIIDAREHDFDTEPFPDMRALEAYAEATSSNAMRLAARILGAGATIDDLAREAGVAYALTGLLRALPYRSARRRSVLPGSLVSRAGIDIEDIFAGQNSPALKSVIDDVASNARTRLRSVVPLSPALLPAALCPLYLRVMTRVSFDPFRDSTDVAPLRRQWAMLRARWRGKI